MSKAVRSGLEDIRQGTKRNSGRLFFFQAEDGIRERDVTGVQTCALPIYQLVECNPDDLHHSIRFPEDCVRLDAEIEQMRQQPKDFALIQSRLRLNWEQIANAYARVEEAHLAASVP